MAIGTLLFTLLLFCVLLMYTKRHHTIRKKPRPLSQCSTGIHRIIIAKNSALAGIGVNKGNSTHGITRDRSKWINHDKCSIINYTSSESSKNTLPHILKETMPGSKKSCHPSRDYLNEHPPQAEGNIVDTTGTEKHSLIVQNSFTHLERSYPEQGDQSLTVMIPRAKYHASVLPQMQLFHQQVANERSKKKRDYPHYNKSDDTTLMSIRQDNICNIMQHPINVLSRITSKKLDINRTNQPKATPTFGILCNDDCEVANMHMRQLGALVSAGFEVSAIVGENILNKSSSTTSAQCSTIMSLDDNSIDAVGFKSFDSQPKNNETNVAAQTKLTLSEKPRHQYQQITQSKLGFDNEGEHHSIQNDVVIYQGDNRFN
ncbi:uncharacterized protein LOC105664826 [Ceratitis capitata]|uniref:uncharacterized protein LOC105664826 n=1 Tax=Ceratitis capitata TaxID=7213 RepID=UPI000A11B329|nr:uncharacterized protein LOC105664826 [Ceratitis capitata]